MSLLLNMSMWSLSAKRLSAFIAPLPVQGMGDSVFCSLRCTWLVRGSRGLLGSTSSSSMVISGPSAVASFGSRVAPVLSTESPFMTSLVLELGLTVCAEAGFTPTTAPAEEKAIRFQVRPVD